MATSGVFNGTNLLIKVNDVVVGHTTSCTFSVSLDAADATTKDSNGWAESIAGLKSGECSFDGLVDYSDSQNSEQLLDLLISRTKVDIAFGTAATGDSVYEAEAYVTSLEQTAEMEAAVTYSGTLTITGPISKSTN